LWISYFHAYLNETGRAGFVMASSATDSQGKDKDIREKLVGTGDIDVLLSVGNNFFYTKSLPCTLWFFDKAKRKENEDKVLFIDARNYYTVVDRTLNEWNEWQMKNLNAIVWLYRGETEKYTRLLNEYIVAVRNAQIELYDSLLTYGFNRKETYDLAMRDFTNSVENSIPNTYAEVLMSKSLLNKGIKLISDYKAGKLELLKNVSKERLAEVFDYYKKTGVITLGWYKKQIESECEMYLSAIKKQLDIIEELEWLYEKFGEGEYKDILGLCKCASRAEIAKNGYSITPGAYVGVAEIEDDGVDFAARMAEIHSELLTLQAESNELMDAISKNMKEMGL
jgi:type I restriction enzyme M protein